MTRMGRIVADRNRKTGCRNDGASRRGGSVMAEDKLLQGEHTEQIIKAFYHVYNTLGYGFLEKVYEKALVFTLRKWGLEVRQQVPLCVFFEGEVVGEYLADVIVAGRVLLELKAAESLCAAHEA